MAESVMGGRSWRFKTQPDRQNAEPHRAPRPGYQPNEWTVRVACKQCGRTTRMTAIGTGEHVWRCADCHSINVFKTWGTRSK